MEDFSKHSTRRNHTGFFVHKPYYDRFDYVLSQWIAVTVLFTLWGMTLLAYYAACYLLSDESAASEGELAPLLPPSLSDDNRSSREKAEEWKPRLQKAAAALRSALMMLLAVTVFLSIPLPFFCREPVHLTPGFPIPVPGYCGTCLTTGSTNGTAMMSFIFLALTVLWLLMELVATHQGSATMARTIVSLCSFPLILATFIVGLYEWHKTVEHDDPSCL